MMTLLSTDHQSLTPEDEISSRRGALKLLLMDQASHSDSFLDLAATSIPEVSLDLQIGKNHESQSRVSSASSDANMDQSGQPAAGVWQSNAATLQPDPLADSADKPTTEIHAAAWKLVEELLDPIRAELMSIRRTIRLSRLRAEGAAARRSQDRLSLPVAVLASSAGAGGSNGTNTTWSGRAASGQRQRGAPSEQEVLDGKELSSRRSAADLRAVVREEVFAAVREAVVDLLPKVAGARQQPMQSPVLAPAERPVEPGRLLAANQEPRSLGAAAAKPPLARSGQWRGGSSPRARPNSPVNPLLHIHGMQESPRGSTLVSQGSPIGEYSAIHPARLVSPTTGSKDASPRCETLDSSAGMTPSATAPSPRGSWRCVRLLRHSSPFARNDRSTLSGPAQDTLHCSGQTCMGDQSACLREQAFLSRSNSRAGLAPGDESGQSPAAYSRPYTSRLCNSPEPGAEEGGQSYVGEWITAHCGLEIVQVCHGRSPLGLRRLRSSDAAPVGSERVETG